MCIGSCSLIYANMTIPGVPEGIGPVIRSNVLGTHIEFTLADVYQIFRPTNLGDHCYLKAFNDLPAYGKNESEVYFAIPLRVENLGSQPN